MLVLETIMCVNLGLNIKEEPMEQSDHDRLIEIATDVKWIKEKLSEHLIKHWRFTILIVSLMVGAVITGRFFS